MAVRPVAAVIIPTHDHASTLDMAVRSTQDQSVENIEILVVGDGVRDDTRDVISPIARDDPRVRFLDFPKGPGHGEIHRGTAIESATARVICYLCDDDLLLPDHVESMVDLLAGADLAQSLNGYFDVNGEWHVYWGDLGLSESRQWLLRPDRNFVSLTGTAHTVAAYRRLPYGWRTTPPGRWIDHYMWEQFLRAPSVRAVTATRVTALQFPSHMSRDGMTADARREELQRWAARVADPEWCRDFQALVLRLLIIQGARQHMWRDALDEELLRVQRRLRELEDKTEEHERAHRDLLVRYEGTQLELQRVMQALLDTETARQESEQRAISADADLVRTAAILRSVEATRTWKVRNRLLSVQAVRWVARTTARRPVHP